MVGATKFSDAVILCVLNEEQCESVIDSFLPGFKDISPVSEEVITDTRQTGRIVSIIVTATVAPDYVAALPQRVSLAQSRDLTCTVKYCVIDAPISGGSIRSEQGSLIVMSGAPSEDLARVEPVLKSMTNHIPPGETTPPGGYYVCGPNCGDGMLVKVCHQLIAGSNLASAAEGYALAKACGVFSDTFVDICTRGAASSFMLKNRGHRIQQVLSEEVAPCMSRLE